MHQVFQGLVAHNEAGNAKAGTGVNGTAFVVDDQLVEHFKHPLRQFDGFAYRGVRQQQRELFAPQPGDNVRFPNPVLQQPGDLPEHLVAGIVAIGVVNLLEVVQVHHHHGQRAGMALGVAEQLPAKLVEGAAVVKAGQLVFQGCGLGLLVSLLEFQFHLLAPGDIGGNFQSHQPAVGVHIQQFVGLEVGNVNQGIKVIEYSLKPGRRCGPGGRKACIGRQVERGDT